MSLFLIHPFICGPKNKQFTVVGFFVSQLFIVLLQNIPKFMNRFCKPDEPIWPTWRAKSTPHQRHREFEVAASSSTTYLVRRTTYHAWTGPFCSDRMWVHIPCSHSRHIFAGFFWWVTNRMFKEFGKSCNYPPHFVPMNEIWKWNYVIVPIWKTILILLGDADVRTVISSIWVLVEREISGNMSINSYYLFSCHNFLGWESTEDRWKPGTKHLSWLIGCTSITNILFGTTVVDALYALLIDRPASWNSIACGQILCATCR